MRTTVYLATARGLTVINGSDDVWRSEVALERSEIQCVAVEPEHSKVAFCGTFGSGIFRTEDCGKTWSPLRAFTRPNVSALACMPGGIVYAGTELSAMYRSDDCGDTWRPLHTLMSLPSAKTWSFPPRPQTHHVQAILPSLIEPGRLHVAVEAGALIQTDDAGATWSDRVASSPLDSHTLAAEPHHPARLHSAAGDGYFETNDDGLTWQRFADGLDHQYCWSVAVGAQDPATVLLTASASAYDAHYKAAPCSFVYRRSGDGPWQPVHDGLPAAKGTRIAVVAASRLLPATFYCAAEGKLYRSSDDALHWQQLPIQQSVRTPTQHPTAIAIAETAE